MLEIREPSHSESEERLLALEELHEIGVLDWNELVTERVLIANAGDALPPASTRLYGPG